MFTTPAFRR